MNNQSFAEFYKANSGLIHKTAGKIHRRTLALGAGIEYNDIVQEASIVMLRAWERFDESRGFKFSTYFTKACYFEINKIVAKYENDANVLGLTSMSVAGVDEGESFDMESQIDGGHGSPEQMLEAKQTLNEIKAQLSPIANAVLDILIDPPEQILREWEIYRSINGGTPELTLAFIGEYIQRITDITASDIRYACQEIGILKRHLNQ